MQVNPPLGPVDPGWFPYGRDKMVAEWDGEAWTGATKVDETVEPSSARRTFLPFLRRPWFFWMVGGQIGTVLSGLLCVATHQLAWALTSAAGYTAFMIGALMLVDRHFHFGQLPNFRQVVGIGIASGFLASGAAGFGELAAQHYVSFAWLLWTAGPFEETAKLAVPFILLFVVLDGQECSDEVTEAGKLLAAVIGQDLEENDDGQFRIARRVARDRIISTVDPDARHGHKTTAHRFDGYKGHVAIDPDTEIITATTVTPGNAGDASVAQQLLDDIMKEGDATDTHASSVAFGDASYGTGPVLDMLQKAGVEAMTKVQPPHARNGRFTKDAFVIDLDADTVTCPNGIMVGVTRGEKHPELGVARFGVACRECPLQQWCTTSRSGRSIQIGAHERQLAQARETQRDPTWKERYRSTRPKVERKLAHLMRREHGARHARVRGQQRVEQDFAWLAAASNLARLATLQVGRTPEGQWSCS